MALTRTSLPGPTGSPPGFEGVPLRTGGRLPGPLDFHSIFLADLAATKAAKAATTTPTLVMPPPTGDMTKYARVVTWPLYGQSGPQTTDISQGNLGDCPLPSLLAAMANIPSGRKKITDMLTEHKDKVITDLSALKGSLSGEQPAGNITSQRWFTVAIGGKSIDVSDVFFTDDADSGWSLLYMQASDTASVLWACVIEKACAALLGGYDKLNEVLTVNAMWKIVLRADPHGFEIGPKTSLDKIKEYAAAASKQPTILASQNDPDLEKRSQQKVLHSHGYAVLKLRGNNVDLYNPWGNALTLSVAEIKLYFQAMFYP
jgi:hypothetical protein